MSKYYCFIFFEKKKKTAFPRCGLRFLDPTFVFAGLDHLNGNTRLCPFKFLPPTLLSIYTIYV